MTAKSQPMAGQPDAADDLIAELAKLMAQDAESTERPAAPAFSVRIPGGDEPARPAPAPAPRFDFERSASASPAATPARPATAAAPEVGARPGPAQETYEETPEPFRFDFDLGAPKPAAQPPSAAAPRPVTPAPEPVDHDSIADLIAAELAIDPQPTPPSPKPAPTPAPASAAELRPAAPQPPSAPASEPAPAPEPDRFKIAPVFGLASRPSAEAPRAPEPVAPAPVMPAAPAEPVFAAQHPAADKADDDLGRDPIDEIENLIGRAMRVEFDKSDESDAEPVEQERPVPSPALRSLATPTMPAAHAEPPAGAPRSLSGADEAILAAAEATGAQIGWVEAPEVDEAEPVIARRQRSRVLRAPRNVGMSRALAGPVVAVTLLLAAGFGLYWVLGLGRDNGPAPLLTADTSPVKETPAPAPEPESSQSIVFNEINGVVPGAEEQLVSRDQADVNEVTQIPPADISGEGLANRKVRTVTVRPDGTIVSGEDSVAGSTILPVVRPDVPAIAGAEPASPELLASTEPEPATPAPEPVAETPPAATVVPVTPGSTVPAVDPAGNPLAGKTAPVPMIRPAGLVGQAAAPTSPINAVVDTPVSAGNTLPPPPAAAQAPAQPAAVPQAVEVDALPNNAPAYVQLASQRSEAEARATAQSLVGRFGPLFGGANMEVQRVDLGTRGIYYRVRVPANSRQEANTICNNVKAAGGDCIIM